MEIFSEFNENHNLSLALGYFDGVHKGHQAVITSAVNFAKEYGKKSAVITFKDHPCCFLWDVYPKYILTREERRRQIEHLGVDFLYEIDFEKISNLSAEQYLEDILIKYFEPIAISTGFNHNFGANKSGNTDFLKQMSTKYGYKYFMLEAERDNSNVISSTIIRKLLSKGNIKQANAMLGYNFPITGTVIKGQQLGRKLGFKTANIKYPQELITLPYGAYATIIIIKGEEFLGVTNFGTRPTVATEQTCTVETHILDFDKDIYGKSIRVEFLGMIRPECKFESLEALKLQIKNDIFSAKSLYNKNS